MSTAFPHPQIMRGLQLKQLGRFADAVTAFKEALAQEPNDAFALHQLAGCQWRIAEARREALQTIDQAIAIEPNGAEHHVLRAFILCALDRPKEALLSTQMALSLDPNDSYAHTAEAQAYLQMENWPLAERSAREALALDADNSGAANQLAQALRLQNKLAENAAHLAGMLARDPEDAFTHANAGWAALQRGEHRAAEVHFREALRLDPDFDYAREGLLSSFRARSPLYRGYLKYCFAMARLNRGARWAVILGFYFGSRVAHYLPGGYIIVALYFLFVLWVWVARPVGNAMLLADRFARFALRPAEKIEAAAVSSCLAIGITGFILNLALNWDSAMLAGVGGVAIAFPLSLVFTNQSVLGRWIFGGISGVTFVATILGVIADAISLASAPLFVGLSLGACVACAACTWLGNIRALYKRG
ncbi:TPR repeat-containing protein [Chthoniobacter flavus Ellin428]|uniref:TPR repeat-containing protein n=1 Tax=Chthoniobacter flavus Ellin428 TaxID=497964 RepID=B4D6S9_9BACT|nr:tetratricopeptide repeat protein [Chthoniobacter flavus]EDY17880.1 TPR repeat-containing protein [Chthoniobacter flavus Ellin428]TCO88490.1 tetratricopeptide repeat protein [Chthoniobacter flavus]